MVSPAEDKENIFFFVFASTDERVRFNLFKAISMLTRSQKEQVVSEVAEQAQSAKSAVFVDYRGLTVSDVRELKKKLREVGGTFRVVKKTLIARMAQRAGIEIDESVLDGQVAVVFSQEDEVAAVKAVSEFAKANKKLRILGGVLEKKMLLAASVEALAKMPSKQEMLARVVGTIQAPISGFVRVLGGNLQGLVTVLRAVSEKK